MAAVPPFHPARRRVAQARARVHLAEAERLLSEGRVEPVAILAQLVTEDGEIVGTERAALSLADRIAAGRYQADPKPPAPEPTRADLAKAAALAFAAAVCFALVLFAAYAVANPPDVPPVVECPCSTVVAE